MRKEANNSDREAAREAGRPPPALGRAAREGGRGPLGAVGALTAKTLYEVRYAAAVFIVGAAVVEALLAYALPTYFQEAAAQILHVEVIRNIVSALLGSQVGEMLDPTALAAIAWVHPMLLALVWALEITFCTRVPAGEVDRGTIDVLLGLPVSRSAVMIAESLVWLGLGACLMIAALGGHVLGRLTAQTGEPVRWAPLLAAVVNLGSLYVAVGGLAWLVSAACDRRGKAVAVTLAVLLASFMLNFLAPFSRLAESLSFLSLLDYYRPWDVLRTSEWPVGHCAVLLAVGAATWAAALTLFCRRDICTV